VRPVAVEIEEVVEVAGEDLPTEDSPVLAVGTGDDGAHLGQVGFDGAAYADLVRAGAAVGDRHDGVPLLFVART